MIVVFPVYRSLHRLEASWGQWQGLFIFMSLVSCIVPGTAIQKWCSFLLFIHSTKSCRGSEQGERCFMRIYKAMLKWPVRWPTRNRGIGAGGWGRKEGPCKQRRAGWDKFHQLLCLECRVDTSGRMGWSVIVKGLEYWAKYSSWIGAIRQNLFTLLRTLRRWHCSGGDWGIRVQGASLLEKCAGDLSSVLEMI